MHPLQIRPKWCRLKGVRVHLALAYVGRTKTDFLGI